MKTRRIKLLSVVFTIIAISFTCVCGLAKDKDSLEKAPTPSGLVENIVTTTEIEVTPLEGQDVYGEALYRIDQGDWSNQIRFTDLNCETTYTIQAKYKGNESYSESEPVTIEVTTLDGIENYWITIPTITSWKYNDQPSVPVGEAAFGEITYTYCDVNDCVYSEAVPTEVGHYQLKATVMPGKEYGKLETTVYFEIYKQDREFENPPTAVEGLIYNGKPQFLVNTIESKRNIVYRLKGEEQFNKQLPTAINAGDYVVEAKLMGDETSNDVIIEIPVTIAKKNARVELRNSEVVYGDSLPQIQPEFYDFIENDVTTIKENTSITIRDSQGNEYSVGSSIGNYEMVVNPIDNSNYNITYTNANLTVLPRIIEYSIDKNEFVYNGKVQHPLVNVTNVVNSDECDVNFDLSGESINVGEYTLTLVNVTNSNYALGEAVSIPYKITAEVPEFDKKFTLKAYEGMKLKDVRLPDEHMHWVDDTLVLDKAGEKLVQVEYVPSDTLNYQSVTFDVMIDVLPIEKVTVEIEASDKTFTVGDTVDTKALLDGVKAYDSVLGDISGSVIISKSNVNPNEPGTYSVEYEVRGSTRDVVKKSITVTIKAKEQDKPVEEEKEDEDKPPGNTDPYIEAYDRTIYVGDYFDPMEGVVATDLQDGTITSWVVVSENTVDTSKPGVYKVTYDVTDAGGAPHHQEISVTVLAKPTVVPTKESKQIYPLLTVSDITIHVGDDFDPLDYVQAKDEKDGDISDKVEVKENTVDTSKSGSYKVTYEVTNSSNNTSKKTVKVTVEDEKIDETVSPVTTSTPLVEEEISDDSAGFILPIIIGSIVVVLIAIAAIIYVIRKE